jgi:microcystin synthetase protein McyA
MEEIYLLSSWLRHHGVGVGLDGVVGILSPTTADYLIAIVSILQSGGSVLPFYTNYTNDLISALVINANVKFMIIDESIDRSRVPEGCPYFCLRKGWKGKLESLSNDTTGFILETQPPIVPTTSCAMLAMTSGSTGTPKAIVVSHHATVLSCCVR